MPSRTGTASTTFRPSFVLAAAPCGGFRIEAGVYSGIAPRVCDESHMRELDLVYANCCQKKVPVEEIDRLGLGCHQLA
jgi:hypothetical protein